MSIIPLEILRDGPRIVLSILENTPKISYDVIMFASNMINEYEIYTILAERILNITVTAIKHGMKKSPYSFVSPVEALNIIETDPIYKINPRGTDAVRTVFLELRDIYCGSSARKGYRDFEPYYGRLTLRRLGTIIYDWITYQISLPSESRDPTYLKDIQPYLLT